LIAGVGLEGGDELGKEHCQRGAGSEELTT
jgi:hypothetical protein